VLCSSYSGETEETLACFDAATRAGARRIVVGTGGALVERARAADVPVIGLPGILQPRGAVAYMFVSAAAAAALAGAAPGIASEIEAAAGFLRERVAGLGARAAEVAAAIAGDGEALPIVCGSGLTAPVARRWKTQINENAKLQAFVSELPEADHNEICGWDAVPEEARAAAILIEDPDGSGHLGRRFALTGEAIAAAGIPVVRIEAEGGTPTEKVFWSVMLGDLVSLELAAARGVDPLEIGAIERLKSALARP
jgi:glucose/mannose-6-phosphate isomerase